MTRDRWYVVINPGVNSVWVEFWPSDLQQWWFRFGALLLGGRERTPHTYSWNAGPWSVDIRQEAGNRAWEAGVVR
jgi:hypothetical protein